MIRSIQRCALVAGAVLVAIPLPASAYLPYETYNRSSVRAWITIQDWAKTRNLDWGWVEPRSKRVWKSGQYVAIGRYFITYEFKEGDRELCRTRIEAHQTNVGMAVTGYYDRHTNRCWIDLGVRP